MNAAPYRVMFDYGTYEGFQFEKEEFKSPGEAIKWALSRGYSTPFIIVQILEWSDLDLKEIKK